MFKELIQPFLKKRVTSAPLVALDPRPLPAGRVSFNESGSVTNDNWAMLPPLDFDTSWRMVNYDLNYLDQMLPKDILDVLIDLSPETGKAIWDFLRLCNPGWEYKAYELGSEDKENLEAKEHLDQFIATLRILYGSFDIILGRYFIGAYLGGGFFSEIVLDAQATESVDLVAPDPYSIRFRKRIDPVRGEVWEPGQWQNGKFVSLDKPTIKYLPVDPTSASPYGRPLATPALFTAVFILNLLHDVKRVVMQQGYKRMDISMDLEAAEDAFTFDNQGYATFHQYVAGAIEQIKTAYRALQPDDAFVHTSVFTLNPPAGTLDSDSIGAIAEILDRLEKMVTRGLKSTSLLLESGNSPSETDSNRRWEIHAAGVKSLQHHCENMLEAQLQVSLQAKGIQARVEFRFSELRASEMLRDEQTRQLKIANSVAEYQAGFTSQDEASNNAVNHDADSPEPRGMMQDDAQDSNSDGEENLNQGSDSRESYVPTGFHLNGKTVVTNLPGMGQ